jgi:hypothetical protein
MFNIIIAHKLWMSSRSFGMGTTPRAQNVVGMRGTVITNINGLNISVTLLSAIDLVFKISLNN